MTGYQFSRTALRFLAISGCSFTLAILAQSTPVSLAWAILGLGAVSWLSSLAAAIIKQGDDSWAMVAVTVFGLLGALVGIGELLATIQWASLVIPALAVVLVLGVLLLAERFISKKQQPIEEEVDYAAF